MEMIMGINDSEYLEMLAHWFDQMQQMGRLGDSRKTEVQDRLRRIAGRLRNTRPGGYDEDN